MKLILTRHGETLENVKGISQGQMPGTLSEKGVRQAKRLASRLKDTKIDAIYSSDLRRAKDTAKEILKFHPETETYFLKSFREVDLKSLTGTKINWVKGWPEEVETVASMQKRAKGILDKAFEAFPNGTVLFVGHAGINKALTREIFGLAPNSRQKIPTQPNASVTVFKIREGKNHEVKLLNCSSHLE